MPYYFSYVNENYPDETEFPSKVVLKHPDDCTWSDLTNTFEQFLRGCGFVIGAYDKLQLVNMETGKPQEIISDVIATLEQENNQLRARNQRLQKELDEAKNDF